MLEAKLCKEDLEVAIEWEKSQILAIEYIVVAIDAQAAIAYEVAANLYKVTDQ
jgi:hypothetical protein